MKTTLLLIPCWKWKPFLLTNKLRNTWPAPLILNLSVEQIFGFSPYLQFQNRGYQDFRACLHGFLSLSTLRSGRRGRGGQMLFNLFRQPYAETYVEIIVSEAPCI